MRGVIVKSMAGERRYDAACRACIYCCAVRRASSALLLPSCAPWILLQRREYRRMLRRCLPSGRQSCCRAGSGRDVCSPTRVLLRVATKSRRWQTVLSSQALSLIKTQSSTPRCCNKGREMFNLASQSQRRIERSHLAKTGAGSRRDHRLSASLGQCTGTTELPQNVTWRGTRRAGDRAEGPDGRFWAGVR